MSARSFLSWFFRIGLAALAAFLLFFAFSFSGNWSLSFNNNRENQPAYSNKDGIFSQPKVELSAENIFGTNITGNVLNTALSYLMAKNPQGPKGFSTSTITTFDKIKMNVVVQAEAIKIANQELRVYAESELMVVPDSVAATDNYLASLKKVSDDYLERFRNDDLESLAYEASKNGNNDARKTIIDFVDNSGRALEAWLKIPVPRSWTVYQLGLLNLTSETRYTALGYLLFENDPVRGKLVFNNYQDLSGRINAFNRDFQTRIQEYVKIRQ